MRTIDYPTQPWIAVSSRIVEYTAEGYFWLPVGASMRVCLDSLWMYQLLLAALFGLLRVFENPAAGLLLLRR